jgi:hypothetical protein
MAATGESHRPRVPDVSADLPQIGPACAPPTLSLGYTGGTVVPQAILAGVGVWCLLSVPAGCVIGRFLRRAAATTLGSPAASVTRLPLERRVAAR